MAVISTRERSLGEHGGRHSQSALLIKYRWGALAGAGGRGARRGLGRGERRTGFTPPRAAPHSARPSARAGHGRENRWHYVRVLWWQLLVPPVEPGQRVGRLPMWVAPSAVASTCTPNSKNWDFYRWRQRRLWNLRVVRRRCDRAQCHHRRREVRL